MYCSGLSEWEREHYQAIWNWRESLANTKSTEWRSVYGYTSLVFVSMINICGIYHN